MTTLQIPTITVPDLTDVGEARARYDTACDVFEIAQREFAASREALAEAQAACAAADEAWEAANRECRHAFDALRTAVQDAQAAR